MSVIDSKKEKELLSVVIQAGKTLLSFWPGRKNCTPAEAAALKIQTKADGSFVTEADFASNKLIVEHLQKNFPADGILSEEVVPSTTLAKQTRVWILDPLDGTQSFIDGRDDYSILLALCVSGEPKFAIMHFPARGVTGIGREGGGAILDGQSMQVSKSNSPRPRSVYLRHLTIAQNGVVYDQWMDSGLAFLSLCQGKFDGIILKIVNHREWDLAAPALLIQESGGRISDEFGKPITFNRGIMDYKYFVASNGLVHAELLALIPDVDK